MALTYSLLGYWSRFNRSSTQSKPSPDRKESYISMSTIYMYRSTAVLFRSDDAYVRNAVRMLLCSEHLFCRRLYPADFLRTTDGIALPSTRRCFLGTEHLELGSDLGCAQSAVLKGATGGGLHKRWCLYIASLQPAGRGACPRVGVALGVWHSYSSSNAKQLRHRHRRVLPGKKTKIADEKDHGCTQCARYQVYTVGRGRGSIT